MGVGREVPPNLPLLTRRNSVLLQLILPLMLLQRVDVFTAAAAASGGQLVLRPCWLTAVAGTHAR